MLSNMIIPNTWTDLPGCRQVRLYAVLRKPSITCSSTFIIQTPKLVIVLDPGADEAQVEHVGTVIASLFGHGALPLYLFLTHSHVDHLLAMPALMGPPFHGRLFCHPLTAEALARQDGGITQADMIDITVPRMKAQAKFFDPPEALPLDLIRDLAPRLITGTGDSKDESVILSLQVSDEDALEVLPIPGHSPDSVCYRVGSLLFTGDLHLATSPGLAGLKGWNNNALARSISRVLEKCRAEHISCIVPGHGPPIDIDKAEGYWGVFSVKPWRSQISRC
jgi:glyoxylase-like metal-dependent hydrolase (beta-lactamase superfamily II)